MQNLQVVTQNNKMEIIQVSVFIFIITVLSLSILNICLAELGDPQTIPSHYKFTL